MWEIIERTQLFNQVQDTQGRYEAKSHLAEMIALLGPPPKELLAKENAVAQDDWPRLVTNDAGTFCKNAREYFGGPFFDAEGLWSDASGYITLFANLLREIPPR